MKKRAGSSLPVRQKEIKPGAGYSFTRPLLLPFPGYWDLRIGNGAEARIYLNGRRKATSALAENLAERDWLCLKMRLKKGESYQFVAAAAGGADRSGNRACLRLTASNPKLPKITHA